MGESRLGSRPFSFNGSIEVKAVDENVSSDAGALLMRELMERCGLVQWLAEHLIDDRRRGSVAHSVGSLLRTFLLLIVQGHTDQDDADRLRRDPSLRTSARDTRGCRDEGGLASQPTLSRFLGILSREENLEVLQQGILKNAVRRLRQAFGRGKGGSTTPNWVTVDIDDVPLLVHGEQPGSGYNSYVGHECYHAVVSVCGESGDILGARLRNPVQDRAQETHDLALEAADALLEAFPGSRVLVRMDAGFASGGTFDTFEELNIDFLARIRNNPVLNRMAEPHLERPGDLAADEVRTVFHEATYRAANWSRARRVVLVVIHRDRELFPRHFWLITSLSRQAFDTEALLKRYRVRGKAEKTFGELKTGLNPQLSSSARPKSHFRGRPLERETEPAAEEWRPQNEAILLLNLLAFQLMHEGRCGMETAEGQGWSIGKFREQVLRAGCRVAWHARTMTFHIAQSVAVYWWKLLEVWKRSILQMA
ncbi:MAG: IS1380 family transposase [Gammaproteobacteria bacterium]|nr:IS1380 family transposase [Gammaproteobacteria bacterium]